MNLCLLLSYLFVFGHSFKQDMFSLAAKPTARIRAGLILGVLGGLLVVFSIPTWEGSETRVSMRSIALVLAGVFGGVYAALPAALLIAVTRLFFFGVNEIAIHSAGLILLIGWVSGQVGAKFEWPRAAAFHLLNVFQLLVFGLYLLYQETPFFLTIFLQQVIVSVLGGTLAYYVVSYLLTSNSLTDELKKSEQRYRDLSENYNGVLNRVTEVIYQTDNDGRWTYLNPAWEAVSEYSVAETLGHYVFEYGSPEEVQDNQEALEHIKGQPTTRLQVKLVTKSGSVKWVEALSEPLLGEDGKTIGTTGTLMDITERKEAELRMVSDMELSKRIQQSVLPAPHYSQAVTFRGSYVPSSQLSGDMYTWRVYDCGTSAAIIIDVMGHGVSSSLVSMYIHAFLQNMLASVSDPVQIMDLLNKHLCQLFKSNYNDTIVYCTALCVQINPAARQVHYVNAGHPYGIGIRDDGKVEELSAGGLTLGIDYHANYQLGMFSYETAARILLYTDGLFEVYDTSPRATFCRLRDELVTLYNEPIEKLLVKLELEMNSGGSWPDDICLLAIEARV